MRLELTVARKIGLVLPVDIYMASLRFFTKLSSTVCVLSPGEISIASKHHMAGFDFDAGPSQCHQEAAFYNY